MNKTISETKLFCDQFNQHIQSYLPKIKTNVEYGIAAPFTSISTLNNIIKKCAQFKLVAQNVHHEIKGAYTGEISAAMLVDMNVKYVLIGHSERRLYNNEDDSLINKKLKQAISNGLIPILCVGETLAQYEQNLTKIIIKNQIEKNLVDIDPIKIIIAYEPIWAIGTGKTATSQVAQDICKYIRSITHTNTLIQYGGSVNPQNIHELMSQPDIDGALVGGSSLMAEDFLKLVSF